MAYYHTLREVLQHHDLLEEEQRTAAGLPGRLAEVQGISIVRNPNAIPTREYYQRRDGKLTTSVDSEFTDFDRAHNLDLDLT